MDTSSQRIRSAGLTCSLARSAMLSIARWSGVCGIAGRPTFLAPATRRRMPVEPQSPDPPGSGQDEPGHRRLSLRTARLARDERDGRSSAGSSTSRGEIVAARPGARWTTRRPGARHRVWIRSRMLGPASSSVRAKDSNAERRVQGRRRDLPAARCRSDPVRPGHLGLAPRGRGAGGGSRAVKRLRPLGDGELVVVAEAVDAASVAAGFE